MFSYKIDRILRVILAFAGGFTLGQAYYYYLLKKIQFPKYWGCVVSLTISGILGIGNAVSIQMRCISVLTLPMYCGKPGRGVLKALVLTYIVAGPISNMGSNAREIVRVFACSAQLSYNLSMERYALMLGPSRKAALGAVADVEDFKKVFRSIRDVLEPIQFEIEETEEVKRCCIENDFIDDLFSHTHRSVIVERKFSTHLNFTTTDHVTFYRKKLQYRCENQLSRAVAVCIEEFSKAYNRCCESVPVHAEFMLCWPLQLTDMCNLISSLRNELETCDSFDQVPPGLERGYASLERVKKEFISRSNRVHLQYKAEQKHELLDTQDAKETAKKITLAFEEKAIIMHDVITVMNICVALLFVRIFNAAVTYHDLYLMDIDCDNVYVTPYFKKLDSRRKGKYMILPLKKMERCKYTDIHSVSYKVNQNKLAAQILKVMLEVVTATTFLMLDRLFYEALEVVRQHAESEVDQQPTRDLEMEVEGTGLPAASLRRLLDTLGSRGFRPQVTNKMCVPRPRMMPCVFFFKIYGGYLWILLLWFIHPYTSRLRRAICSYFYPKREKHRVLHLYNDILKKRMKMDKTLRRKALQAVRAHYLTGENLLSMRMKFPHILGWLRVLPAARMSCLICGEVEPRTNNGRKKRASKEASQHTWYSCFASRCPFVYCRECWREAGARCLACDPSLLELSDIDSITEDERPAY